MDLFWPHSRGRNRAGQSGRSPLSFMPNIKPENSLRFLVARSYFFYWNINITLFFFFIFYSMYAYRAPESVEWGFLYLKRESDFLDGLAVMG